MSTTFTPDIDEGVPVGPPLQAPPLGPPPAPLAGSPLAGSPLAPAGPGPGRRAIDDDPADDPGRVRARWERPALATVLIATAVLYIWGLSASGWSNSFYSAAVQAGSVSWKAFLFGSSDAANSITVDKPPASLWVMALSVRAFGLSSWSILVPEALMGVGTVAAVWYAVRRWFSAGAALLAAIAMAVTPVAVLMFRFNNPDALLVLLMTLAAITTLRGIEDGRRRWILATGALVGFGFLTKQLQVMLIVPPLALAHLVAAPGRFFRRVGDLLLAGAAMVVSAGWWIALVSLWPAGSRPYIGGSQTNSILELTFGYNGFGRLTGAETGSVTGGGGPGGAGGSGGMWGQTGITRMIDGVMGGQIAWLLPLALASLVVGLWLTRRASRTDLRRASLIVWGGWLVVTALVFSFMAGIFHEYYTVALAPAIAALVGIGADQLWRHRSSLLARMVAAVAVLGSALWAARLLDRATNWNPWLAPVVLGGAVVAALALIVGWHRRGSMALAGSLLAGAVLLAGPSAWALQTAATPHSGSIVTAGPAVADGNGPGRGGFGGPAGAPNGPPAGAFPNGAVPNGALPNGAVPGANNGTTAAGGRPAFGPNRNGGGGFGGPGGGAGGLLSGSTPSAEVVSTLLDNADRYTWVAATVGANNASGYQLSTQKPVMPLGGFNGSDPSPTLAEFQALVSAGEIHYFIEGGGIGPNNGGSSTPTAIANWVTANFTSVTVGGTVLYDLTQPMG